MRTKERLLSAIVDIQIHIKHDIDQHTCAACQRWDELQAAAIEACDEIDGLRAEVEALCPDAERYQYIRHYRVTVCDVDGEGNRTYMIDDEEFEELDEAVDALRGKGE